MGVFDLLRRRRQEQELDEELRAHLAMAVLDRVARGEDPRDAETAARRELGNVALIAEDTREVWGCSGWKMRCAICTMAGARCGAPLA